MHISAEYNSFPNFLGATEVTIANMYKAERSKVEGGFVPTYILPKKHPCLPDPSLGPLVTDVEDIFIHGIGLKHSCLCEF